MRSIVRQKKRNGKDPISNSLGARAICIKNLDTEQLCLLGHTIGLGPNGSRDVSAVAIAVGIIAVTGKVLEELCAAFELL